MSEQSILRQIIQTAAADNGMPLKDLTVLASSRDPYRLDTPANHILGQWLADAYRQVCRDGRRLHIRGLHYRFVGQVTKPDGKPYINDDDTWEWLQAKCVKAARFLGYLPWDAIRDARNSPPEWYDLRETPPGWQIQTDDVYLSLPENLTPRLVLNGDLYRQPWQQVLIAEKQGVADLLRPICEKRNTSMVLPSGELSDTMLYEVIKRAAEDGRPLAVHQLGDFDPAGHQMAVSTARTAQAIRDSQFPDLEIRVHAIGLTLDQCQEWQLPSTPLKESERRADRWHEAMGWEQTELDAAVALKPTEFQHMVRDCLDQYRDNDLSSQGAVMRSKLMREANARLAETLGPSAIERIRNQLEEKLPELEELVNEINEALAFDPTEAGIDLPETPEVIIGDWQATQTPLLDTADDWASNTRRLIARKAYQDGEQ